jgi:hypothetical protein
MQKPVLKQISYSYVIQETHLSNMITSDFNFCSKKTHRVPLTYRQSDIPLHFVLFYVLVYHEVWKVKTFNFETHKDTLWAEYKITERDH